MDKKKNSGKSFEKLAIGEPGQKTLNYPLKSRFVQNITWYSTRPVKKKQVSFSHEQIN